MTDYDDGLAAACDSMHLALLEQQREIESLHSMVGDQHKFKEKQLEYIKELEQERDELQRRLELMWGWMAKRWAAFQQRESVNISCVKARTLFIQDHREAEQWFEAGAMRSEQYHPNLHLLAVERTGWRRWVFGRWVYNSEPFRRDIQRKCAELEIKMMLESWERLYPSEDFKAGRDG